MNAYHPFGAIDRDPFGCTRQIHESRWDTLRIPDLICNDHAAHLPGPDMINGAKKRLLVVATTLALTASSAFAFTAPASATPPGNAADSRALPGALNDLSSQHDSGRDAPVGQVPAFSVSASQQMHGRVGGQALVDVNISRRKGVVSLRRT